MYLLLILFLIIGFPEVKNSISQIGFHDRSDTICVYMFASMDTLEVNLNIILEISICHLENNITQTVHQQLTDTKELLIIQLSNECSLIQQLTILRNISWIQNYSGIIIFSVNHTHATFEHTLLTYLSNEMKRSLSSIESNDILHEVVLGFIDSNEANRLKKLRANQSNAILYRLNRSTTRFDPSIFLVISIILICMLIGNEWHQRIFIKKLLRHYQNDLPKTTTLKEGVIVGLLLVIASSVFYLIDRYAVFIIKQIYLSIFMIFSSFILYLSFDNISYLFLKKWKDKNVTFIQWFRVFLLLIAFLMIVLWFVNRFTYLGFLMTNFIVFCTTIVIIVQMRIGNLMICMIIFSFIFIFEMFFLIWKKFQGGYEKTIGPASIWTIYDEDNIMEESMRHMFENSGFDCLLSGGSMNILGTNTMKWIIEENLPLVFSFPRFIRPTDTCGFYTGRIYLSIDDIIFPSLLINFCRLFDIGNNIHSRIYYIQVLISYSISFFVSYMIMIVTKHEQLLSIIIYPILTVSTILTGLIRGDFRKLLKGTLTKFDEQQKTERPDLF